MPVDGSCFSRSLTACPGKAPRQRGPGRSQAGRWERLGITLYLLIQTPAPRQLLSLPARRLGMEGGPDPSCEHCMSLPHARAVPSPCLIPSGTNLRWSKAPSSRARSAVSAQPSRSVCGGWLLPRGDCASSPQAKNRRQSSKNKVLGASLQRRAREEQDLGRCCKKQLDSARPTTLQLRDSLLFSREICT